jgi:hypothetical protein
MYFTVSTKMVFFVESVCIYLYLEYIQYDTKSDLKLGEFNVGVTFESRILIDKDDFKKYIFGKDKKRLA